MDASDFLESLCTVNGYAVPPKMREAINKNLHLMKDIPIGDRTLTSFVQYANGYVNPDTNKPIFREAMSDYLYPGGKYARIFDSSVSRLALNTRFLAIEMEALMNRGENCVVPALVYLFNMVEKKFDGRLTLLVLDEAWLFLKNESFSEKITEWLKVLRKKNVYVVFATQDVGDVLNSPLRTTIAQQCLTKIYLADNYALTPNMIGVYGSMGLTDTEIELIAKSQMKQDYFYTSPLGRRMFQLDLGPLSLALIGTPKHDLLDDLIKEKGAGIPLCKEILARSRIDYSQYMGGDAPNEEQFTIVTQAVEQPLPAGFLPPSPKDAAAPANFSTSPAAEGNTPAAAILDAVSSLPARRKKGQGRVADELAQRLGISPSTVYQAMKILKFGGEELIERVRNGEIGIKKASRSLKQKEAV